MYSARAFARSEHLDRTAPFDGVLLHAIGINLRDPRVREGNLRCVAVGPTQLRMR
jgi:hypothetical protein